MKKKRSSRFSTSVLLPMVIALCLGLTACGASAAGGKNEAETVMETAAAAGDTQGETVTEGGDSLTSPASLSSPQTAGRKLIRNVDLWAETEDFEGLLRSIHEQVASLSGYVEQSDVSGSSIQRDSRPSRRHASITARIPADQLDSFLQVVEDQANVTERSETATDVTLQYSDLESRKKTLTTEQERIWALLEKADTLEAVIALEERLSEIRYQLESMESQLKLYDNQVDYSTVSIHISEVAVYTPTGSQSVGTRIQDGFKRNLTSVKTAVVDLFVLVASTLPIWLPVILVFAAAAAGIRYNIGRNSSGEKGKKDEKPKKKLDDLRPGGTPPGGPSDPSAK